MRKLNAQRAAEASRKKAKEEADRALYLDYLAKRENAVWKQVEAYIQKRQPKDYDRAVILLTDLHDLAIRQGGEDEFHADSGPCGQLIPVDVGTENALMWAAIPL